MRTSITALLNVADVAASVGFYERLGFTVEQRFPPDGAPVWVSLALGESRLMLNRQTRIEAADRRARPHYGDLVLYLDVPAAAAVHARLAAAGVAVTPVERQAYGVDEFTLRDPDGYELAIASDVPPGG